MDAEFPLRSSSQERIATTRSKHSRWLMPSHTYKESVGAHAAGDVVAVSGAIGPATRSVFGRSSTAAFVELVSAHRATIAECVIEFGSRSGGKMRSHWKGSAAPDWSSLLHAWREAER